MATALLLAGGATAAVFAVRTITLQPGKCKTVSKTLKVCAAKAASGGGGGGGGVSTKTVTTVKTVATTVTVGPSPIGKTFSGAGNSQLATFTLKNEDTLNWTESQPDGTNGDCIEIDDQNGNDLSDNSLDCTVGAGSTVLQPGTYTLTVTADAPWTITL